jgi:hypothetical protein
MSNLFTRLFGAGDEEVEVNFNYCSPPEEEPQPAPCTECGGLFLPDSLRDVFQVAITCDIDCQVLGADTKAVSYCERCKPQASIILVLKPLKSSSSAYDDERRFSLDGGFFQDVDSEGGEQYVVTAEDYAFIYCSECGEVNDETECRKHRAKAPAPRGKKS